MEVFPATEPGSFKSPGMNEEPGSSDGEVRSVGAESVGGVAGMK